MVYFIYVFFLMIQRPPRSTLFPTRRSSDLLQWRLPPVPVLLTAVVLIVCAEVGGASMVRLDRKSTRLNSSHVAISYAVFCLKKKNKHYDLVFNFKLHLL